MWAGDEEKVQLDPGEGNKVFRGLGAHGMKDQWLFIITYSISIPLLPTSYQHSYLPSGFGWDVKGVPGCPNNQHHLNPFASVISSDCGVQSVTLESSDGH